MGGGRAWVTPPWRAAGGGPACAARSRAHWETVGNNGRPPRDDSSRYIYLAIAVTIGVVLPIVTGFVVLLT